MIAMYELKMSAENFTVCTIFHALIWDHLQRRHLNSFGHWGPQMLINITVFGLCFSCEGIGLQFEI